MRYSLFIAAVWCVFAGAVIAQDEEGAIGVPSNTAPSTQAGSSEAEDSPKDILTPQAPTVNPPVVPEIVKTDNPENPITTQEDSSDEIPRQDLEAQQSMARAAWAMFWGAFLQIILGCVGVVLIYLTLTETRRTLVEAEKATQASQVAADAARTSIEVSRAIADSQARPWVSVECSIKKGFHRYTTHLGVDGVSLNIFATAKNHGSTPATNVIFRAEMGIPTAENGDLMAKFCDRFRDIPDQTLDAIFPAETKEFSHNVFLPISEILDHVSDKEFKAICPIVYGLIHYKSHHTLGIRQTRFQYGLSEIRDGGCFVFFPDVDEWTKKNIALTAPAVIAAD